MDEVIIVNNLSKKFKIGHRKRRTALARFLSLISGKSSTKILWALKNVSFDVKKGEFLGIIGENGSGKSTLLRVLVGIYGQNSGFFNIRGRISGIIDLNRNLNVRLTLRDNIYYLCSLLDMSREEIRKKFNSIVELAELKNYIDTKLYQLSKGMMARLAFSITIHQRFDIMLIDEIFTGEDEHFKSKILEISLNFKRQGKTILLVSHDLDLIKKYCDKVIWMKDGKIKNIGKPGKIIKEYKKEK